MPPRGAGTERLARYFFAESVLLGMFGGILGLALMRAALNYVYTISINLLVQQRLVVDLRGEIYDKLQRIRIDKLGFTVEPRGPAAFRPYQIKEIETWVKIAKDAGIQPEE